MLSLGQWYAIRLPYSVAAELNTQNKGCLNDLFVQGSFMKMKSICIEEKCLRSKLNYFFPFFSTPRIWCLENIRYVYQNLTNYFLPHLHSSSSFRKSSSARVFCSSNGQERSGTLMVPRQKDTDKERRMPTNSDLGRKEKQFPHW